MPPSIARWGALILVVASRPAGAAPATVLDAETMLPVAGASVTRGGRTIAADAEGRFDAGELREPVDVTVTAPGYETMTDTLSLDSPVVLLFKVGRAEVITVSERRPPATAASTTLLTRDEIRGLPGGGEDALAAVRSMPGVGQAPPTAAGRLVIRGAAPEDTRLTIDGISVPFLYHAFNNTTILPPSSIAGIAFTPGGFGVEEGRATGGVVALSTDDTLPTRATGTAALSLLEVSAQAALPLGKTVALSGGMRRSTVDLLAPLAVPEGAVVGFTTAPRFYDGQMRLDWRPSANTRFAVLGILGFDALGVVNQDPDSDLPSAFSSDTRFSRLIASYKRRGDRYENRLVGAVGADRWSAEIGIDQNVSGSSRMFALRDDLRVEASDRVQVRAGWIAELARIATKAFVILPPSEGLPPGRIDDLPIYMIDDASDANYAAAYAATDLVPAKSTTITAGVRVEGFGHVGEVRVNPRVQVRHRAGPVTMTGSLGRYARDLDGPEGIPTNLRPEVATQATLGAEWAIREGVSAAVSGFATLRRDLVVEDASLMDQGKLPYRSGGTGTGRGLEVLLRAHRGNFFGWVAYTLSRSERRDAPLAPERPFAYDQTHLVSAVGSWVRGAWSFGGRWQLATGLPYTEVTGATYNATLDRYLPTFGTPLAARFSTNHSLDLRVERVFKRDGYRVAVFADLSNVYRNARILRFQYSDDFMMKKPVSDLMPLPSLGVRGEF